MGILYWAKACSACLCWSDHHCPGATGVPGRTTALSPTLSLVGSTLLSSGATATSSARLRRFCWNEPGWPGLVSAIKYASSQVRYFHRRSSQRPAVLRPHEVHPLGYFRRHLHCHQAQKPQGPPRGLSSCTASWCHIQVPFCLPQKEIGRASCRERV